MKLGRFEWNGEIRYGVIEEDQVLSISGEIFDRFEVGTRLCALDDVRLLPPVYCGNDLAAPDLFMADLTGGPGSSIHEGGMA